MLGKSLGATKILTDKTDMKEVDVTHTELGMSVCYIKHLIKAKKVSLSHNTNPTDNANGRHTS